MYKVKKLLRNKKVEINNIIGWFGVFFVVFLEIILAVFILLTFTYNDFFRGSDGINDKNNNYFVLDENYNNYYKNYDKKEGDLFKDKTTYYRGFKIEFFDVEDSDLIKSSYKFKKDDKYIIDDTRYYVDLIKHQIDLQYEVFNYNEDYYNNLKIYVCNCDVIINDNNNNEVNGFYNGRNNHIVIRMASYENNYNILDTLAHEIGHFHYRNTLKLKNKIEYANKFLGDYDKKEFFLETFNLKIKDNIKWEDKVEEKIVEDIKSLTSYDNYNSALKDYTSNYDKEFLLNIIKK